MKKLFFVASVLVLLPAMVFSQSFAEKRGDKYFDRLAYVKAADFYSRAAMKKGNDHVYERLGDCYRLMGHPANSETWYQKVATGAHPTPSSMLHYAEALRAGGKYAESQQWMSKYYALNGDDKRAQLYASNADYYEKLTQQEPYFYVYDLMSNTTESDFGATFMNNKVVFASSRIDKVSVRNVHTWNDMPFLDLYVADRDADGMLNNVAPLTHAVNTRYHEGPACFTADGKTMYFTRNNYFHRKFRKDSKGINNLKIYRATNVDGEWKEENLAINSDEYSVGHPALSPDGKTLYFVSDMPGGRGATDLYRATINSDGSLGKAENLGGDINTEGKEMFPFVDKDGNLYFSSDGQLGLGGLDVFYAANDSKGGFAKPLNIGAPVNSSADDFALTLDASGTGGYLSSNRAGGKGDDDLYAVKVKRPFKTTYFVKGIAKDKATGAPLAAAKISLKDVDGNEAGTVTTDESGAYQFEVDPSKTYALGGSKEKYFDGNAAFNTNALGEQTEMNVDVALEKDPGLSLFVLAKEKETMQAVTDVKIRITNNLTGKTDSILSSTGDFRLPIIGKSIGERVSYNIAFEKQGYLAKTITYNAAIEKEGEIRVEETMDKISVGLDLAKIIDIKPIYFDLGKSTIRPDAAVELDKIVKVMNENPTMVVELGSHTDCRGTAASNMALSDRRAKASAEYIRKRITNPERIYGKGYGESQLANGCACEGAVKSSCPEEEHAKNRRTEFRIIKM